MSKLIFFSRRAEELKVYLDSMPHFNFSLSGGHDQHSSFSPGHSDYGIINVALGWKMGHLDR